jgi:8-oxo-dGDP phosphatase
VPEQTSENGPAIIWTGPVIDEPTDVERVASTQQFRGHVVGVRSDTVNVGDATVVRDIVIHPGAVGIVAINDADEVLLIRQLRVPVGSYLFEPPAGLLDKADEDPLVAAQRELVEEAGLQADHWYTLIDAFLSPGGSSEAVRVYLARGVTEVPGGRPWTGEAEERDLPQVWLPLDVACQKVLDGELGSPLAVAGVLAAARARDTNWTGLRPADAPWPARAHVRAIGNLPSDLR